MRTELLDVNAFLGMEPRLDGVANDVRSRLAEMDRFRIGQAVVTHTRARWQDPIRGNQLLIEEVRASPRLLACWVLLPGACAELPAPGKYVLEAIRRRVVAFRAFPREHGYPLNGTDCRELLEELSAAHLPLIVDAGQSSWDHVEQVATDHPGLNLIVCDVGYRALRELAGVLDRAPRVHIDLTNLTSQGAVTWLSERFGPSRLLYGSGAPTRDPAESIASLWWSDVDDEALSAIAGGNAARLLHLSDRR